MSRIEDLRYLIGALLEERGKPALADDALERLGEDESALFEEFRALVNTRPPEPASDEFLAVQDRLLQSMIREAGITHADDLPQIKESVSVWRGDITTLDAQAIVNAANSQLLGCWVPGHYCIDNAIHTFAGIQLRIKCAQLMRAQGHDEQTGKAKITPAYNLPSKHVLHTVGPIASGEPSEQDCELLSSCYKSCLDLACIHDIESIAFCCISTGVFGFPQEKAARIAVDTVREWISGKPQQKMHVVFDVFSKRDEELYLAALS